MDEGSRGDGDGDRIRFSWRWVCRCVGVSFGHCSLSPNRNGLEKTKVRLPKGGFPIVIFDHLKKKDSWKRGKPNRKKFKNFQNSKNGRELKCFVLAAPMNMVVFPKTSASRFFCRLIFGVFRVSEGLRG